MGPTALLLSVALLAGLASATVSLLGAVTGNDYVQGALALLAAAVVAGVAGVGLTLRKLMGSLSDLAVAGRATRQRSGELAEALSIAGHQLASLRQSEGATQRALNNVAAALRPVEEASAATAAEVHALTAGVAQMDGGVAQVSDGLARVETGLAAVDRALAGIDRGVAVVAGDVAGLGVQELAEGVDRRFEAARWHREGLHRQVEALLALYRELEPPSGLPPLNGWAVGADLGRDLVEHVLRTRPAVIVELGSGSSTALLGLALVKSGGGVLVSFEHDPQYAEETRRLVGRAGVAGVVELIEAPLGDLDYAGDTVSWYDISGLTLGGPIDLLLIDGPPSSRSELARLPAALLFDRMAAGGVAVLDDGDRPAEREILRRWLEIPGVRVLPHPKTVKGAVWLGFEGAPIVASG